MQNVKEMYLADGLLTYYRRHMLSQLPWKHFFFLLTLLCYPQRKAYSVVENLLKLEAAFLTSLNIAIEVNHFLLK